jgi:glycosyltransferase involved in cell wall biosynthesis
MQKLKVSLIITTYNWPEALFLVLKSVKNQFILPDEIIVADDGSSKETANVIKEFSNKFKLKVIHSWQEDKGFRAAMC